MATPTATVYQIGDQVPYHFLPGLIVASYFVSLVGAITTVELLHRRKTGNDWRSWLQLGACAVSFGLVAIWCMHFVGNRAIVLGDGQRDIQLFYSPGFTALSVFLPIIFLFVGFLVADRKIKNRGTRSLYLRLTVCGVIAGLAITGMHYVGNFGTANYKLYNNPAFVVGAALIAMTSCVFSLTLFFHQKEQWINSWWRRLLCACVLACAVSGMHWVASIGTTYQLTRLHADDDTDMNTNMIVAIAMSLVACLVCFTLVFLIQRRRRQLADRAQHVVLASATFDRDGRLLVTQEGLMPCQKITRQYNQQSFDDEFDVAHPVFQWIFRVTHNWAGVTDLISGMRSHLRAVGSLKEPTRPGSQSSASSDGSGYDQPYATIFREHFCVAASDLAGHLGTSLHNLGTLFDEIMMTGTMTAEFRASRQRPKSSRQKSPDDVEARVVMPAILGKGQLLFVVRQVGKQESARLETLGFRFATFDHIGDILARSMQASRQDLAETVTRLRTYARKDDVVESAGIHLACFALQPAVKSSNGDWNVLVKKEDRSRLPTVQLSNQPLTPWQMQFLTSLDGSTVGELIEALPMKASAISSPSETLFAEVLFSRIVALRNKVPESFFRQAIFSAKPVELDQRSESHPIPIRVFAFCVIPDVHSSSIKNTDNLTYTPFSFFNCRQHVRKDSAAHAIMARRIHREFGPILAQKPSVSNLSSDPGSVEDFREKGRRLSRWGYQKSVRKSTSQPIPSDGASDRELVGARAEEVEPHTGHAFGGIMVSSDVTWTVDSPTKDSAHIELTDLGTRSEAGVADVEQQTFVSELLKSTCALWQRN